MKDWKVLPLDLQTFADFVAVIEEGRGAWGGCWCLGFHLRKAEMPPTIEASRRLKEQLVAEGRTHAALVYDGPRVVGWCQFGTPQELSNIKHRKEYLGLALPSPDWRITCFFVDREYRRQGVASAALAGALSDIAQLGGGKVESYPEDTEGRKVSSAFLYNAPLAIFERQGFERVRRLGMNHWVVNRIVPPSPRL